MRLKRCAELPPWLLVHNLWRNLCINSLNYAPSTDRIPRGPSGQRPPKLTKVRKMDIDVFIGRFQWVNQKKSQIISPEERYSFEMKASREHTIRKNLIKCVID